MKTTGMRQVLRLPRQELAKYDRWLRGDKSWKGDPIIDGVRKGWFLYFPDGWRCEIMLRVVDNEKMCVDLTFYDINNYSRHSIEEYKGMEGEYYGKFQHDVLIISDDDNEDDW